MSDRHKISLPFHLAMLVTLFGLNAVLNGCVEEVKVEGTVCNAEHPCPEGYACNDETNTCQRVLVACDSDDDCPAGVCLHQAHVCVACRQHGDCISGLCHIPSHVCIGCKADYQCPSGKCDLPVGICEKSSTKQREIDN